MRYLMTLLLVSCAAVNPVVVSNERVRPTPDQMAEGRVQCRALCGSYGREFREYMTDGNCVCWGKDEGPEARMKNQM